MAGVRSSSPSSRRAVGPDTRRALDDVRNKASSPEIRVVNIRLTLTPKPPPSSNLVSTSSSGAMRPPSSFICLEIQTVASLDCAASGSAHTTSSNISNLFIRTILRCTLDSCASGNPSQSELPGHTERRKDAEQSLVAGPRFDAVKVESVHTHDIGVVERVEELDEEAHHAASGRNVAARPKVEAPVRGEPRRIERARSSNEPAFFDSRGDRCRGPPAVIVAGKIEVPGLPPPVVDTHRKRVPLIPAAGHCPSIDEIRDIGLDYAEPAAQRLSGIGAHEQLRSSRPGPIGSDPQPVVSKLREQNHSIENVVMPWAEVPEVFLVELESRRDA